MMMKPKALSITAITRPVRKLVKDPAGVSLIELIIVIILLAVAFPAFMQMLNTSDEKRAEAEIRTIQTTLANDLMNEIRSRWYDDYYTEEWSTTLGPELDEISLSDYDDVDDFHGWSEAEGEISDFPHYSRSATVEYVDVEGDLETPVTGPTDYKLVTVTISHRSLSDIVFPLVITPGIPDHHYNHPLCLAEKLELENIVSKKKRKFHGPFPKREMTFMVDGGTGTFLVNCTICLQKNNSNNLLKIRRVKDPSGVIDSLCQTVGAPVEIIVDNTGEGGKFTQVGAGWQISTDVNSYFTNHHYNTTSDSTIMGVFEANIPEDGDYIISAWWVTLPTEIDSTLTSSHAVRYRIRQGTETLAIVTVDQSLLQGDFNELTTVSLIKAKAWVDVYNVSGLVESFIADAVMFEK
ncbi:MAG: hypothetical protein ISR95_00960 [Candidatus Marinimicrobia bacterium]|nr:hypothetical protein [Candidatus Neomarinimicrobiota bacterium]MBL7046201.1 hypothetical protein [Candidatus Neomarinimicrobiota bacterium]